MNETLDQQIEAAFDNKNQPDWPEGPLKQLVVDYVGEKSETEQDVTMEMMVEVMAKEFPEFLLAVAEENWIRGYHQAMHDVDEGRKLLEAHQTENNETGTN